MHTSVQQPICSIPIKVAPHSSSFFGSTSVAGSAALSASAPFATNVSGPASAGFLNPAIVQRFPLEVAQYIAMLQHKTQTQLIQHQAPIIVRPTIAAALAPTAPAVAAAPSSQTPSPSPSSSSNSSFSWSSSASASGSPEHHHQPQQVPVVSLMSPQHGSSQSSIRGQHARSKKAEHRSPSGIMKQPVQRIVPISKSSSSSQSSTLSTKIELTPAQMRRYFLAPQPIAARCLGVSVSTLKRRYYENFSGRWPYQSIPIEMRKRSVYFLMNDEDLLDARKLDADTEHKLSKLFASTGGSSA